MTVAVNVEGTKRALDRLLFDLKEAAGEAMADCLVASEAAALAAIKAQTKRRTGDLEDKLVAVQISPMSGKLFDTSEHAEFIDKGTVAHVIRAKKARALAFQVAGAMVFRRVVNHPGTKARPFVAPAMAAGERALATSLTVRVNGVVSRF
ncbi:hypothetical protein EHM76_06005 [bacterium]|nr:MAG: hypothetical protein EHM76_06005 [bacterium]